MFVRESRRDTSFARVSLINIIWFVLTSYYLSLILSWANRRMIQDDLRRTRISLDMERCFSTCILRYKHIQASGLPKTRLISLRSSPSVGQMGRMQPEGQYGMPEDAWNLSGHSGKSDRWSYQANESWGSVGHSGPVLGTAGGCNGRVGKSRL